MAHSGSGGAPGSLMVPDADDLAASRGLAKLTLAPDPSPAAMEVFGIKFSAALSSSLSQRLQDAFDNADFAPKAADAIEKDKKIYNALIGCMPTGFDDDIIRMKQEIGRKGPACLEWLDRRYNPDGTATAIKTIFKLFSDPIASTDVVNGINAKMSLNGQLPADCRIPEKTLAPTLSEDGDFWEDIARMCPPCETYAQVAAKRA